MRFIFSVIFLLAIGITDILAQRTGVNNPSYALSFDFDMVIRDDDLGQEGIGFAVSIGGVKYLGEEGRYRLIPSIEYGSFKWEQDDLLNDYFSLNMLASMDLFKWGKYSIPMSGGLVLDYSKNSEGESRIKESYRLYFGSRIDLKSNWAIEFLNTGLAINQDFISLKVTYIRAEYQF